MSGAVVRTGQPFHRRETGQRILKTGGGGGSGRYVEGLLVTALDASTINGTLPATAVLQLYEGNGDDWAAVSNSNTAHELSISGDPTGGTFTLTFDGQTTAGIAWNASAAAVESALEALSNVAPGDVACAGGPLPSTAISIEWQGTYVGLSIESPSATSSLTGGTSPSVSVTRESVGAGRITVTNRDDALSAEIDDYCRAYKIGTEWRPAIAGGGGGCPSQNAKRTLTIIGQPTSGAFTLEFGGDTSGSIAYNATASDVESELEALSSIGSGNVTVTGGPLPNSPVQIEFTGSLGSSSQGLLKPNWADLAGNGGIGIVISVDQAGGS